MKKSKTKLFFICLVCGVIFLLVGIYLTSRTSEFKKNGKTTQAEIVLIEKNYDSKGREEISVYVKYTVQNTTYTRELDYYSNGLREGDMITISYLPNNPSKITYSKFNTIPQTLFFVGGSICIICSIACLVAIVINKFNCNKSKGNRLIAIIKDFDYRQNLRVFGKHPASLVCVDSIGNYYKTRFLYDKQKMIAVGSFVVVYVDEENSKKYFIDINSINNICK